MNGTLQFGKFKFVADNPYNQITKLRGNCLMQLPLFCSSEKSLTGNVNICPVDKPTKLQTHIFEFPFAVGGIKSFF